MTSPAAAIAAVMTFRFFNAPYSFAPSTAISACVSTPAIDGTDQRTQGPLRTTPVWR
jgi:hypothetical protein